MCAAKPRLALIEGGRVAEKHPAPAWLSAFAVEEWRRVVPFLQRRKALHARRAGRQGQARRTPGGG